MGVLLESRSDIYQRMEAIEGNKHQKVKEPVNCKNLKTCNDHEANKTEKKVELYKQRNESKVERGPKPQKEPCKNSSRDIPIVQDDETIDEFDTKQVIQDNSRVQMKLLENSVNLVVHVQDLDMDGLKVRFEDDDLVVTGRNGDETVVMTKTLPSDCIFGKALSHLTSDGMLMVKIPRKTNVHPFQNRINSFCI